jgi:phage gp46-like protein
LLKYDSDTFNLITEKNIDILNNYGDFNLNGNQFAFVGDFNAKIMFKLFTNRLFFSDGKAWVGKKEELENPIEEVKFED